jgi:hypothetical protein
MVALELPCARRQELVPRDAWQHPSCPDSGLGSWGHGTRGGSEVTLSQEAVLGATGHMTAPELLCVRRQELAPRTRSSTRAPLSRDSGAGAT